MFWFDVIFVRCLVWAEPSTCFSSVNPIDRGWAFISVEFQSIHSPNALSTRVMESIEARFVETISRLRFGLLNSRRTQKQLTLPDRWSSKQIIIAVAREKYNEKQEQFSGMVVSLGVFTLFHGILGGD